MGFNAADHPSNGFSSLQPRGDRREGSFALPISIAGMGRDFQIYVERTGNDAPPLPGEDVPKRHPGGDAASRAMRR
jgi:hypothetical protein